MRNQILGNRYRIIDRIGEGGMAYVYVAMDEKLGRKVAIKVLHEHMERNPDIRKRFQMEAQAVSSLEHPNIVKVYDFSGAQSERLWIVTEVIRGKNLAQYAQSTGHGWIHPVLAACIVREICKALDKAHQSGIVHRDIKPENIMLTTEGRVKLMDFGIAKDLGKNSMTVEGTFMGSPSYMSPEQIRGRNVDLRSDLYSLSVLFYEIVTGRLPFTGQTTHDVVLRIIEGGYTHPRYIVPTIPLSLNELIVKGMSKNPELRFQTARDLGRELDLFLSGLAFDESHIELERYFKDPQAYALRLEKIGLTTNGPRMALRTQRSSQGSAHRAPSQFQRDPSPRTTFKIDVRQTAFPQPPPVRPAAGSIPLPESPRSHHALSRTGHAGHSPAGGRDTYALPPSPPPPPQVSARIAPPVADLPMIRREISYEPSAPLYGMAQAPRRRAPIRPVRREAAPVGRRHVYPSLAMSSWTHAMFGVLVVGIIGIVAFWGFWELQGRLHSVAQRHRMQKDSTVSQSTARPMKPTKSAKRRDGTPVTVKHVSKYSPKNQEFTPANKSLATETSKKRPPRPNVTKKPPMKDSLLIGEGGDSANVKKKKKTAGATIVPVALPAQIASSPQSSSTPTTSSAINAVANNNEAEPSPEAETTNKTEVETKSQAAGASKDEAKPTGKAKVAVSSQPAAEVFINGKRIGTTLDATSHSGFHTLEAGKHQLELRRQGYRTHKIQFELVPGEQKTLPQVVLEPDSEASSSKTSALTLRVDHVPVSVVIRNVGNESTQAFVLKSTTRTLQLDNGHYEIKLEHEGETKERDLVLSGNQVTFSAEFKTKAKNTAPGGNSQSDE